MTFSIENIQVLPPPAVRLIGTSRKDLETLKKDLREILGQDRSLSVKFLRLVNSPYFSFPHKIGTIEEALRLGDPMGPRNLLFCLLAVDAVQASRSRAAFHSSEFLWHSLQCAILAKETARRVGYPFPEDAFLIGYVHDIGKLILLEAFGEKYDILLEICRSAPDLLLESELRLGSTHPKLAAQYLGRWGLPSYMTDAILYHHESRDRVAHALPLVKIVYVAHSLCGEPDPAKRYEVAEELLKLEKPAVLETLKGSKEKAIELAQYLGLGAEPRRPSEGGFCQEGLEAEKAVALRTRDALFFVDAINSFLGRKEGEPVLQILLVGIRKVLGTSRFLLFQIDTQGRGLQCRMLDETGSLIQVEDLSIPMKSEKSLVVRSLTEGEILTSFESLPDEEPVLSDEQITRFLGKKGILCVRMSDRDRPWGVMVIGLDSKDVPPFRDRIQFLRLMVQHAALLLREEEADRGQSADRGQPTAKKKGNGLLPSAIPRDVYHEVNNPLSIIKNYLKILSIKLADRQIAQEEIKIINEEIDRVTKILHERAQPAGSQPAKERFPKLEPVDVNGLLVDLLAIAKASLLQDAKIELVLDLERSLPCAFAEKDGLKQVFINLLKNASEAMSEGGELQIQTRCIQAFSEKNAHGFVEITFRDNGPGVPDEMKQRLFEPFATSKGENHSGLGLSISEEILREMNGSITYEEGSEKGSVFRVNLRGAMNRATLRVCSEEAS